LLAALVAGSLSAQDAPSGYRIEDETVVASCSRCHRVDDDGRMSRISYLRKTPEGWQTSVRRMVALHGLSIEPEAARDVVRYLSDELGLAPEELRPARFEVERRLIDHDYEGDSGVEFTCIQCHSMGRVMTQRRTREEWALLFATHRALYPLVDGQAFRRSGPARDDDEVSRHPMDVAIDHLSDVFPLETPEWSAWAATKRPPRLEGEWTLSGHEPGRGSIFGSVRIAADAGDPAVFRTTMSYVYAETGERVSRMGDAIVYTGYQWRGRSNPGTDTELREVMLLERDTRTMTGRWYSGAYDEHGPDITLRRVRGDAVLAGVYPRALERGGTVRVTLHGGGFPAGRPSESAFDFGQGVLVQGVEASGDGTITLSLAVDDAAPLGERDLYAFGSALDEAIVVHDGIDRIAVTPATGMARVGGAAFPKGHQVFEAMGYDDGPDGESGTDDDLDLGRIDVEWRLDEYAATFGDDDIDFVGTIQLDGTFVPALDGPNPERVGNRNNVGDVWVIATHRAASGGELTARAHLVVTVPLYLRWEPWREIDQQARAPGVTP
jgi:quinohemoprotein amine dehydrogenase